ncbi:MAG TPA: hypothetical protein VGK97_02100, partial [Spongiibacteraceae bacterium]
MLASDTSFNQRMRQLCIISALGALIIGAIALFAEVRLKSAADDSLTSSAALHHLMETEMMHNALHSDVLSALLVASNSVNGNRTDIESSIREHSARLRQARQDNEKLELDANIKSAIHDIEPMLEEYIGSAENLVNLALSDQAKAKAALSQFESSFKTLAEKSTAVSEMIRARQQQDADVLNKSTRLYELLTAAAVLIGLAVVIYFGTSISKRLLAQLGGEPEYTIEVVRKVAAGDLVTRIETRAGDRHSLLYAIMQMQQALAQIIEHTQQKLVGNVA